MNCKYHPNQEAQFICVKCKNPICAECTLKVGDKIACRQCLEENLGLTPVPTALAPNKPKKTFREKFLFLCYSLIPGAAHMHLGLFRRGLQLMIITFGGLALFDFIRLEDIFIPLIIIPAWFFSFFESHHLRRQVEKGQIICDQDLFDRQLFDYTPLLKNRRLIGSSIVVIGMFSLMQEFDHSGLLDRLFGNYFYLVRGSLIPLCLVLGGIYLIAKATRPQPVNVISKESEIPEDQ